MTRIGAGLALACAVGCSAPPEPAPDAGAAAVPRISRLNINQRAIYASAELAELAAELIAQCGRMELERRPRLAFYYVTLDNQRHHLGESLAQDLATQLVLQAEGRVEIYTRRKLSRVMEEQGFQATELVDEATLVRFGRLSGVDFIISGRFAYRKASEWGVTWKLLNVESGEERGGQPLRLSIGGVNAREPMEELFPAAERAARALARAMAGPSRTMAVYDVTRSREPFAPGTELAEALATELARLSDTPLRPLTRSALNQIIEEQKLELSELFDEARCCQIARLAGGELILTGFGEIFPEAYKINLQVVDVETARIHAGTMVLLAR